MSKVLVDPAALEEAAKWLEIHSSSSGSAEAFAADALREAIAQPAEAEGVERWNGLKLAAEVAEEDGPWDPRVGLTDCEAAFAKSASPAVVLELIAALSAVTAERDGLAAARMAYASEFAPDENGDPDVGNVHANIRALKAERERLLSDNASLRGSCKALGEENKQLKRENKRQGRTIAAMAAKEGV